MGIRDIKTREECTVSIILYKPDNKALDSQDEEINTKNFYVVTMLTHSDICRKVITENKWQKVKTEFRSKHKHCEELDMPTASWDKLTGKKDKEMLFPEQMTKTKCEIIEATKILIQERGLAIVPHKGRKLIVSYPAFGCDSYSTNLSEMQKIYFHSEKFPRISFIELTTSESISAARYLGTPYDSGLKEQAIHLGWLVCTSKGVFVNPPKNVRGNPITETKILESLLEGTKKINGIYLGEDDFGFAPYETFKKGFQDHNIFAKGGLARVLEHAEKKFAENLREISSDSSYERGIEVINVYETKHGKSELGLVLLEPDNFGRRLKIHPDGFFNKGYTYGMLNLGKTNKHNEQEMDDWIKSISTNCLEQMKIGNKRLKKQNGTKPTAKDSLVVVKYLMDSNSKVERKSRGGCEKRTNGDIDISRCPEDTPPELSYSAARACFQMEKYVDKYSG